MDKLVKEFEETYNKAVKNEQESFDFNGQNVLTAYGKYMLEHAKQTGILPHFNGDNSNNRFAESVVTAVLTPENRPRLKLLGVSMENIMTHAICWEQDGKLQPMLMVVTPEIFKKIRLHIQEDS